MASSTTSSAKGIRYELLANSGCRRNRTARSRSVFAQDYVVVIFDSDFRSSVLRRGARCLHIHPREITARERLAARYAEVLEALQGGCHLVTVDAKGNVTQQ